jgi:hypothetical protein
VKKQIKIRRSLALLALAKPVEALWAVLVAIYPQEIKAIANPTLLNKPVKSVGYAVRTLSIATLLNKGTRSVPYLAFKPRPPRVERLMTASQLDCSAPETYG